MKYYKLRFTQELLVTIDEDIEHPFDEKFFEEHMFYRMEVNVWQDVPTPKVEVLDKTTTSGVDEVTEDNVVIKQVYPLRSQNEVLQD